MIKMFSLTILIGLHFFTSSCQTIGRDGQAVEKPPQIEASMSLDDALTAGITFGRDTLQQVKKLIRDRKEKKKANENIADRLDSGIIKYSNAELINALHLFQATSPRGSIELFNKLVSSGRPLARILGWNLAANYPSVKMANAMDLELTRRVESGEEELLLVSQMASAVQATGLKSAYTIVREGLMKRGDDAFAKALIAVRPKTASVDLINYLALAPVEELRQLNQSTVDLYSCLVILRHMIRYPPPINHPHFDHLFLYSISRNRALSDLANMVLEANLPRDREHLALVLSRLPAWIQMAYVESARRNLTPRVSRLLMALKQVTPHRHVMDEIIVSKP